MQDLEKACWNLDTSLANHILPKLLYFKHWVKRYGMPEDLEEEDWEEILDEMIWAFSYVHKDYPRLSDLLIEDIKFINEKELENGFIQCDLETIYVEGKTEEDYKAAVEKDKANLARCQTGLNLFSKYYMSLWI